MEQDESLRRYREAVRAYPDLDLGGGVEGSDETAPSPGAPSAHQKTSAAPIAFSPNYEIRAKIAQTQLSTTWKAFDHERQALVVIKAPQARLLVDQDALERFRREVHLVSKLNHANIVPILATHLAEPPLFYTMPLIEGQHLDCFCDERKLAIWERLKLFLKVCQAVIHAHQEGVIHRDLKPNNILVDEEGEPQLLDFGLGRTIESDTGCARESTDAVMGAPGYMAPEQAAGLSGDTRTDVYALGVILFQMLTGALPIEPTRDFQGLSDRIQNVAPKEPRSLNRRVDHEVNAIVLKALAKAPINRYQSVADLALDVERYLSHRPVSAIPQRTPYLTAKWLRRNRWQATAGAVLGICLLGTAIAGGLAYIARTQAQEEAAVAEELRNRSSVLYGRFFGWTGDPVNAVRHLWPEQVKYDSVRTRYALWDFYRRYPCLWAVGDYGSLCQVVFSADGKHIVALGRCAARTPPVASDLVIVESASGAVELHITSDASHAVSICASSQRNLLYVGGDDGVVRVWELSPGRLKGSAAREFRVSGSPVTALDVAGDNRLLAAGMQTGELILGSLTDDGAFQVQQTWHVPARVRDVAIDPSRQYVACVSREQDRPVGDARVYDLDSKQLHRCDKLCRAVLFARDSQSLYLGGGTLHSWSIESSSWEDVPAEARWGVRDIAAPGRGVDHLLAYSTGAGQIFFYDTRAGQAYTIAGFHENPVADHIGLCFSPDGRTLASVGQDGLRLWEFRPSRDLLLPSHVSSERSIVEMEVSRGGNRVAALARPSAAGRSTSCALCLWDRLSDARRVWIAEEGEAFSRPCLSNNGELLAVGRERANACGGVSARFLIVEGTDLNAVRGEHDFEGRLTEGVAWAGVDSRWLVFSAHHYTDDGKREMSEYAVWAWYVDGEVPQLSGPECVEEVDSSCNSICASTDGQWLVICRGKSEEGLSTIHVWRATQTYREARRFREAFECVKTFSVEDDLWSACIVRDTQGRPLVAAGGSNCSIHVWAAESGKNRGELVGHRDAIHYCLPLAAGLLVSASGDGTVRIWDADNAEEVCLLYEHAESWARLATCNGRIAIGDGDRIIIADTHEIERFINGNERFELARLQD